MLIDIPEKYKSTLKLNSHSLKLLGMGDGDERKMASIVGMKASVRNCPLCGAKYEGEDAMTNEKITCTQDDGGCGATFLVKKF